MTIDFATFYIPLKMRELGYSEENYHVEPRHLLLQSQQILELEAYNEIYLLVEEVEDISIQSANGVFDLSLQNINELKYLHQGKITVENQSRQTRHVRFIQIILKKK